MACGSACLRCTKSDKNAVMEWSRLTCLGPVLGQCQGKAMRKRVRAAIVDHTSESARRLLREYKSLTRRKKKQHERLHSLKNFVLWCRTTPGPSGGPLRAPVAEHAPSQISMCTSALQGVFLMTSIWLHARHHAIGMSGVHTAACQHPDVYSTFSHLSSLQRP